LQLYPTNVPVFSTNERKTPPLAPIFFFCYLCRQKMRTLAFLTIFALAACSKPAWDYSRIINAMPDSERIAGQMKPVAEHLYRQNLERFCGLENADSLAFAHTAREVGQYMLAAYKAGQFEQSWQEKKRARIKNSSL
jgi:hypothetical protein